MSVRVEARSGKIRPAFLSAMWKNFSIVSTKAAYGAYSCNGAFPEKSNRADTKGVKNQIRLIALAYGKFESSPLRRESCELSVPERRGPFRACVELRRGQPFAEAASARPAASAARSSVYLAA
jgi:hypothetical protein